MDTHLRLRLWPRVRLRVRPAADLRDLLRLRYAGPPRARRAAASSQTTAPLRSRRRRRCRRLQALSWGTPARWLGAHRCAGGAVRGGLQVPRFYLKLPLLFYTLQISARFYQFDVLFSYFCTKFRAESI